MEQRLVGASGLRVSRIGLGTSTWGVSTGSDEAADILNTFCTAGGTLIDTSAAYSQGAARAILADLLNDVVPREDVVISTASGLDAVAPVGHRVDCSRRRLLAQLDEELAALDTDYLDVWSLAYWDPRTPVEEMVEVLTSAVRAGKVRYAGVRGFAAWQLALAHQTALTLGGRLIVAQSEYSLLTREDEQELLPAAQYVGMGFFAGAALAQGVLTGKYRHDIPDDSRGASEHGDAEVQDYLDATGAKVTQAVVTAAEGLGVDPAAVALAWVRDRPGVTSALVGARTVEQVTVALSAEEVSLPEPILQALDDVSIDG